jgi:peroxiredoxin
MCLLAVCIGCGDKSSTATSKAPSGKPTGEVGKTPAPANPGEDPKGPEAPPPKPTIPVVAMTAADRAMCKVWVDEQFPDAELPDLGGAAQTLSKLRGEKLTVVIFWQSGQTTFGQQSTEQALQDLQKDYYETDRDNGVAVVGIFEGDNLQAAADRIAAAGATFPNLVDRNGALFAKVATEKLPRVYVLDAAGKIRWLDQEFSNITQEKLRTCFELLLGEAEESP